MEIKGAYEDHPLTASTYFNISIIYRSMGDKKQAL
jgi:hypothetical protein